MRCIMAVWFTVCFAFILASNAACQRDLEETEMVPENSDTTQVPQELDVQADDVTLYVRIAGDPKSGNVLIAR